MKILTLTLTLVPLPTYPWGFEMQILNLYAKYQILSNFEAIQNWSWGKRLPLNKPCKNPLPLSRVRVLQRYENPDPDPYPCDPYPWPLGFSKPLTITTKQHIRVVRHYILMINHPLTLHYHPMHSKPSKWIKALDACPVEEIQRFINRSWRWISAYRMGLTGNTAQWAVRKQKGHCSVSRSAMMHLDAVLI